MRNKKAAVSFIFITILIDVIGFGIIIPVLPDLITELTGQTYSEGSRTGGFLLAAFAIMQFIFSPILGGLSDKLGRRPILLFSLFGFAMDYLILAFAPTLGWLFIGRIIAGITGASFTTAGAYIADVSPPEKRAQNFGLIGAAFGIGFIIGPMIGGLLGELGSRVPFFAAAGLTLLNFIYGYFILPESLSKENRRKFEWKRANPVSTVSRLFKYPTLRGLIIALILIFIASHAVQSNWNYYTMFRFNWSTSMVGISLGVVGLLVGAVQGGLIRVIIPRIGQKKAVYAGFILYTIGFALFAFATQGWMMFAILIVYCLGGISGPALQGIISSQVPPNEQGELQGGMTSLMSATTVIGPLLMTNLFTTFSSENAPVYFPGAPFMMGAILSIAGVIIVLTTLRHHHIPDHLPESQLPDPIIQSEMEQIS